MKPLYQMAADRADEQQTRAEIAESKLALAEASHRITIDQKDALLVSGYRLAEKLEAEVEDRNQRLRRLREAYWRQNDKKLLLEQKLTAIERCL